MRTDDLIRALAEDAPAESGAGCRRAVALLGAGAIAAAIVFALIFRLRPDMGEADALLSTAAKLSVTLTLLASAGAGALALMRPEANAGARLAALLVPASVLLTLIGLDLSQAGVAGAGARAMGSTALKCLVSVTGLSLMPFAVFIAGLRAGATTHPVAAGVLAGLAATGIGASLYALNCPEDSPLFLAAWYGASATILSGLGAWTGARALRW